jgi:hypothetical protein
VLLFDALNRRALECYGGTTMQTSNFARFAARGDLRPGSVAA